jgi:uncharacterized protein (TIGR02391 family)
VVAFSVNPDDFLNLDHEQQADLLLAGLAGAPDGQRGTNLILSQLDVWFRDLTSGVGSPQTFGVLKPKREEAEARLRDAYALLEARALIRADPRQRAFCEITPAGRAHLEAQALPDGARVTFARRALDAVELHGALQRREVESHFLQGRYETALRDGSTYLEDAIRSVGGLAANLVGVKLASKAFAPGGPLADPNRLAGEQTGIQQLSTGYFGAVRNLLGHQAFRYEKSKKALQHLMLLDLLTEELADAAARLGSTLP